MSEMLCANAETSCSKILREMSCYNVETMCVETSCSEYRCYAQNAEMLVI